VEKKQKILLSLCIYLFSRQKGGRTAASTEECNAAPWPICISNRLKKPRVYFLVFREKYRKEEDKIGNVNNLITTSHLQISNVILSEGKCPVSTCV